MVCTVGKIAQIMDELAPEHWAEEWDNVGLLLGDWQSRVKKIMVVLDITPMVVQEAANKNVDMIISHHPLIFKPFKRLTSDTLESRLIMSLISNNIAVYSAHTNLDMAENGVDDTFVKLLGLNDAQHLDEQRIDTQDKPGFGRWGRLENPIKLGDFISHIKGILDLPSAQLIQNRNCNKDKIITTIATCVGSGGTFIRKAKKVNADLFVTGEIKYHDALLAQWLGVDTLAVGHFYSEIPIIKELIRRLQKIIDSLQYKVEMIESDVQGSPYCNLDFR